MIEKMKKYSFLIYHKDYESFLEKIRDAGVVHVIEKEKGTISVHDSLFQKMQEMQRLKAVISFLSSRKVSEDIFIKVGLVKNSTNGLDIVDTIENIKDSREKAYNSLSLSQKEIEKMSVWGDFDYNLITKLSEAGYLLTFYACSANKFKPEWIDQYNAVICSQSKGKIYFVTVTKDATDDVVLAERVRMADRSYEDLKKQQEEIHQSISDYDSLLDQYAIQSIAVLKETLIHLQNGINFDHVKLQTHSGVQDKVMILEGWVPEIREEKLQEILNAGSVFYQVQNPSKEESVPVLLRNNKFARLFESIGSLYSLPNYHGIDMTSLWAPFYVMFFGICLGDAGYGLLLTIISLILLKKVREATKPIFRLTLCLGIGTIIFGTISGTFLGIELVNVEVPWLNNLKKIMLDSNQLFSFALILGVIQLSFAMIVKGVKTILLKGFKYSLDTWGWFLCLWGNGLTYYLSHNGTIPAENATPVYIVVNVVAFSCMLLFNNPEAGIFRNIGGGLWGLYNKATGILGDILSYIRLFALGISGSVMGLVFNKLAMNIGGDIGVPVISQLVMVVILVIGHAMNIFMSGLSAFVHPMRLTFVEFYNNAGFESGGTKYNPFKVVTNDNN